MIEPIVVAERPDGKYEIIAGHRRFLASQYAGFKTVPCVVRKLTEDEILSQRIHENLIRADVDPVDEGHFYKLLQDKKGMKVEEIADLVGKSKPYVEQRLQATRWPEEIQQAVKEGRISFSVGREIVSIENPENRRHVLEYAIRDGATVQTVKAWKRQFRYDVPEEVVVTSDTAPAMPSAPTVSVGPPPEGKIMCDVCGKLKPASTVTFVRVCSDCGESQGAEEA